MEERQNKYLADKLNVGANTVSGWITDLKRKNLVQVELIRNDKQEIIQRRIYIKDIPIRKKKKRVFLKSGKRII